MPRVGVSSSGNAWVSTWVPGCLLMFIYVILVIIGILGIAALIYSLT